MYIKSLSKKHSQGRVSSMKTLRLIKSKTPPNTFLPPPLLWHCGPAGRCLIASQPQQKKFASCGRNWYKLVSCFSVAYLLATFSRCPIFRGLEGVRKMIFLYHKISRIFCIFQAERINSEPSERLWLIWLACWAASWTFSTGELGLMSCHCYSWSGALRCSSQPPHKIMYTCHNRVRKQKQLMLCKF